MRTAACSLLLPLATPALGQGVTECATAPPITELVEPWEETTALLGDGAIRVALLEDEAGQGLLVLTLPTIEELESAQSEAVPGRPPPILERRCHIVTEGEAGFALIDVAGLAVVQGTGAEALTTRVPALRFIPESTELEEVTLVLTFGLADGSLLAEIEEQEPIESGAESEAQDSEAAPEPEDEAANSP